MNSVQFDARSHESQIHSPLTETLAAVETGLNFLPRDSSTPQTMSDATFGRLIERLLAKRGKMGVGRLGGAGGGGELQGRTEGREKRM